MTGNTSTTENQGEDRSEIFVRFHRRNLIGVMVIALVLGGISLTLALSPKAVGLPGNLPVWMLPILIVGFSRLLMTVDGRRIDPQSPGVKAAIQDEWRRTNMLRAARFALIVVLLGQCPLGLAFAFLTGPQ